MSIGIDGQYVLSFSVGRYSDFIAEDDLLKFLLIEESGNVLPTFELSFLIRDDKYLGVLTETNDIKLSFGKTRDNLIDTSLSVARLDYVGQGQGKRQVIVSGFLANIEYLYNTRIYISDKTSGVELLQSLASEYNFNVDTNIEKSNDLQRWVQGNVSAKKFVNDVWLHSDVPNSFVAIAMTADRSFIIRDMVKQIKEGFKWRFTPFASEANDIVYDADLAISSKTGLINYWAGYGQNKLIFNLDDDDYRFVTHDPKPLVALTKNISRKASIEKRYLNTGMQNENVHPNYWQAALRNITNLVVFSTISMTVSFRGVFKNIRPLDVVMFREQDVADPNITTEFHSGLYVVSKVVRQVQNRQFVTTVVLNRESFNQVVGDVRESEEPSEDGFVEDETSVFEDFLSYFE